MLYHDRRQTDRQPLLKHKLMGLCKNIIKFKKYMNEKCNSSLSVLTFDTRSHDLTYLFSFILRLCIDDFSYVRSVVSGSHQVKLATT